MEDYYKVLGLKRGANLKEISAAYRSQALIYHPDKRKLSLSSSSTDNEEANEKFFKVKAAYQALQDPKIRAELDLHLVGQEERVKRDAQMSAQRKQMREDLLNREREADSSPRKRPADEDLVTNKRSQTSSFNLKNEDASLTLKCKYPPGIDQSLATEMIKSSLNSNGVILHQSGNITVAEFNDPQSAYKSLCKLPNDLIVKADWFSGYPPDNLDIQVRDKVVEKSVTKSRDESVKYSKLMEESVLERLKRKKLEKQQHRQENE